MLFNKLNHITTHSCKRNGFTLAETLITLVIIGVVAALTVPALINKTNDKEFNTANQKARATLGEAFRTMTISGELPSTLTADQFAKQVLTKYIKIGKHCSSSTECDFSSSIKRPDGTSIGSIPTSWTELTSIYGAASSESDSYVEITPAQNNGTYFVTLDGFHVAFYYNPDCAVDYKDKSILYSSPERTRQSSYQTACFNAIYDMNGKKGPNQVGKDIGFVGSFYNGPITQAAAVLPHNEDVGEIRGINAVAHCSSLGKNDWKLPNINELSLLYLNRKLVTDKTSGYFWSSNVVPTRPHLRVVIFNNGDRLWAGNNNSMWVRCVRNNALK